MRVRLSIVAKTWIWIAVALAAGAATGLASSTPQLADEPETAVAVGLLSR